MERISAESIRRISAPLITAGILLLSGCAPENKTASQNFEPLVIVSDDWSIQRVGEYDFIVEDLKGHWSWEYQRNIDHYLNIFQNDYGCIFLNQEVATTGSRKFTVEDPNCLLKIVDKKENIKILLPTPTPTACKKDPKSCG